MNLELITAEVGMAMTKQYWLSAIVECYWSAIHRHETLTPTHSNMVQL